MQIFYHILPENVFFPERFSVKKESGRKQSVLSRSSDRINNQ